jgi:hypothetical protein
MLSQTNNMSSECGRDAWLRLHLPSRFDLATTAFTSLAGTGAHLQKQQEGNVTRGGGTHILAEAEEAAAVREDGAPVVLAAAAFREEAGSGVFEGISAPVPGLSR